MSQDECIFPEYKTEPATLLKIHRDLLGQESAFQEFKNSPTQKVFDLYLEKTLGFYLRQEISWQQYENAVLHWFVFVDDCLRSMRDATNNKPV